MFMWNKGQRVLASCIGSVLIAVFGSGAQAQAAAGQGVPAASGPHSGTPAHEIYGVGRIATPGEIRAWDIDVRPDFKGLPAGSGTVENGRDIWDVHCASCHGSFGESNQMFTAIVGGTTPDDIESGRVASLLSNTQPTRTTFMKVDTVSTLWDYIHRAMPWNAPKSLPPDDVYAVLAYLLNLAEIVPEDFTLSDKNIAQVQARMPNRNGMEFWEGLWSTDGKPDTRNIACTSNCVPEPVVSSTLPDYARNSNGDLAAQMRIVGPVRGADTVQPALTGKVGQNAARVKEYARSTLAAVGATAGADAVNETHDASSQAAYSGAVDLVKTKACLSCHAVDVKRIGPAFKDIAAKYKQVPGAAEMLERKVKEGSQGVWGPMPMPPHPGIKQADLSNMVQWILAGSPGGN